MNRILLATDFSERSGRALRRAVLLAHETASSIDLVHVVDDDRPRRFVEHEAADALALLEELARKLEAEENLSCGTKIVVADPFAGILQAVDEAGPDLLILGAHRRQILRDAFLGTTAERTIRSATCPVLMVNVPPVGAYRSVLLTTDLTDTSRRALQRFEGLAVGTEALLALLHVFDAPALRLAVSGVMAKEARDRHLGELHSEARRNISDFVVGAVSKSAEPMVRYNESTIAQTILAAADDAKSDLIVAATHCRGFLARHLLGSVTEQILAASSVDVLALPPSWHARDSGEASGK